MTTICLSRHTPGMIMKVGGYQQPQVYLTPYQAPQANLYQQMSARLTKSSGQQNSVICYFSNWAGLRSGDGKYVPENIPGQHCTHVVYAFAKLDEEKFVPAASGPVADIDQDYFHRVQVASKAGNTDAKVLISLGGWADSAGSKYSKLVNSEALRQKFVDGTRNFLKKYNFDGLVMEWHFPVCWQSNCNAGPASDKAGFLQLVQDLKKAFGKRYVLGATLSGYKKVYDLAYDVPGLSKELDFMNIMTYDLHGFWDGTTQPHSSLNAVVRHTFLTLRKSRKSFITKKFLDYKTKT